MVCLEARRSSLALRRSSPSPLLGRLKLRLDRPAPKKKGVGVVASPSHHKDPLRQSTNSRKTHTIRSCCMLGIPGYRYDAATNRYFKLTAAERASAASQQHQPGQSRGPAPGPSSSSGGGRRGRGSGRRDAGASRHAHQAHAGPSRPQQHALSKRFPAARTSARELCDAVASTTVSTPRGAVAAAQLQQ